MSRKNNRIILDSFPTIYYSDPDHPEILKIVDMDQKAIFVIVYGDYDGIVKLVQGGRW